MKKALLSLLLFTALCQSQIITLTHTAYEIRFDMQLKEPLYTHYTLSEQMLDGNNLRTVFKPDNLLKTTQQGSSRDYKNSGYDKGHLSPNDDFRQDETTQTESMYYTNCSPQNHQLNIGTWRKLENYVRKKAKEQDVEVWTGCIYTNSQQQLGKLKVPTHFWKLIKYNGIYEAYLIPNIEPTSKDFKTYKVEEKELLQLII